MKEIKIRNDKNLSTSEKREKLRELMDEDKDARKKAKAKIQEIIDRKNEIRKRNESGRDSLTLFFDADEIKPLVISL